jgi:hypothetical protein
MSAAARVGRPDAHPFPHGRYVALLWLCLYLPTYARAYGLLNFLFLCNLGVMLTAVAVWRGSALLLSMQALAAPVIGLVWTLDVLSRLALGRHLIGGTEYMWDPQFPFFTRLLSCYHSVWPVLTLVCLRRTGYDRRAWPAQALLAAAAITAARFADPALNINGAWRDPVFHRAWGGTLTHLAVVIGGFAVGVYGLTHLVLARTMPAARPSRGQLPVAPLAMEEPSS